MIGAARRVLLFAVVGCGPLAGFAQIDPVKRDLLQVGYNGALQGHQPVAAYAFYYHNQPDFLRTNSNLRLALAPTYLDTELGFRSALGQHTDLGIGLGGGGFADSYAEIDQGTYQPSESFPGHGGEVSLSVYHRFNAGATVPLNGVLRGRARYSVYGRSDDTADNFEPPQDHGTFSARTGLRWGGREPTLYPSLAMELSAWYEGQYRTGAGPYGFGDRGLDDDAHTFWGRAGLAYTMPRWKHSFDVGLSAGTVRNADRFSTFRLGALLPLISEYPLSLPGYYYQEISAQSFVLLEGNYLMPLDKKQRWNVNVTAATAVVEYLDGLEQPGKWHSGVGGGILYRTGSLKFMVGYSYGFDAIRSDGRGAHSIGVLMQLDWGQAKETLFSPTDPSLWRGLQRVFGLFGN